MEPPPGKGFWLVATWFVLETFGDVPQLTRTSAESSRTIAAISLSLIRKGDLQNMHEAVALQVSVPPVFSRRQITKDQSEAHLL